MKSLTLNVLSAIVWILYSEHISWQASFSGSVNNISILKTSKFVGTQRAIFHLAALSDSLLIYRASEP